MSRIVADLHTHTTFSDGRLDPEALSECVSSAGLTAFSVTDHDTVAGLPGAAAAAAARGLEFVPGIEMSTQTGGVEMHILGYYIDVDHPGIIRYTTDMPERRRDRAANIVDRLGELGYPIEMSDVNDAAGEGTIGRPHIAQVLERLGHVSTVGEAFARLIGQDRPAFVPSEKVDTIEAIGIIHDAGGIAVLAHPGQWTRHGVLLSLIRGGLDGLEVRHPSHAGWLVDYYRGLATDFALIRTGGSDFHGHRHEEARHIGRFGVSADELAQLRAARDSRKACGV